MADRQVALPLPDLTPHKRGRQFRHQGRTAMEGRVARQAKRCGATNAALAGRPACFGLWHAMERQWARVAATALVLAMLPAGAHAASAAETGQPAGTSPRTSTATSSAKADGANTEKPDRPSDEALMAQIQAARSEFQAAMKDKRHFDAERAAKRGHAIVSTFVGERTTLASMFLYFQAIALASSNRSDLAIPLYDQVLDIRAQTLGPNHASGVDILREYQRTLAILKRWKPALAIVKRQLALMRAVALTGADGQDDRAGGGAADDQPGTATLPDSFFKLDGPYVAALRQRSIYAIRAHDFAEAVAAYTQMHAIYVDRLGTAHPTSHETATGLAVALAAVGRHSDADALLAKEADLQADKTFLSLLMDQATALSSQGRPSAALSAYARSIVLAESGVDPINAAATDEGLLPTAVIHSIARAQTPDGGRSAAALTDPAAIAKAYGGIANIEYSGEKSEAALATLRAGVRRLRDLLMASDLATAQVGPLETNISGLLSAQTQVHDLLAQPSEALASVRERQAFISRRRGESDPQVSNLEMEVGRRLRALGRYDGAIAATQRAIDLELRHRPNAAVRLAFRRNQLAGIFRTIARYDEALALYEKAIAALEQAQPGSANLARLYDNIGVLYNDKDDMAQALSFSRKALSIFERTLKPDDPSLAIALGNVGTLLNQGGDPAQALPLMERAKKIFLASRIKNSQTVAYHFDNLAGVYRALKRNEEAQAHYLEALRRLRQLYGDRHPEVATVLSNISLFLSDLAKFDQAVGYAQNALDIRREALGAEHPSIAIVKSNLAYAQWGRGDLAEAIATYDGALQLTHHLFGLAHPQTLKLAERTGLVLLQEGRLPEAFQRFSEATAAARALARRQSGLSDAEAVGADVAENRRRANVGLIRAAWGLKQRMDSTGRVEQLPIADARSPDETEINPAAPIAPLTAPQPLDGDAIDGAALAAAQDLQVSSASKALARTAARLAATQGPLAALIREGQDIEASIKRLEAARLEALSQPRGRRDPAITARISTDLDTNLARLAAVNTRLAKAFPAYAALANPSARTTDDLRATIRPDEAIVVFTSTGENLYGFVVTPTQTRWAKLTATTREVADHVQALRCGLDTAEWAGETKPLRCYDLLNAFFDGTVLPFDLKRARTLHEVLFSPFADILADLHLLIVASGALNALPFQVLVTNDDAPSAASVPDAASMAALAPKERLAAYARAPWLVHRNAVTVLPSLPALATLRRFARPSRAARPYLAFADPVLTGTPTCPPVPVPDACPAPAAQPALRIAQASAVAGMSSPATVFRAALSGGTTVSSLCPLPDTAYEVRCIAETLGATPTNLRIGPAAREREVHALSKLGALADARILHFATHGLLAGETAQLTGARQTREPALVLTPPPQRDISALERLTRETGPAPEDDGLLTASEVASLRLDADWVVLSACNTAAGDGADTEAFAGLARAFLYAGARSLLVSHWPVNTVAAVQVTTAALSVMERAPATGRAAALREAMLDILRTAQTAADAPDSDPQGTRIAQAHPNYWAPFVVVGEGGAVVSHR